MTNVQVTAEAQVFVTESAYAVAANGNVIIDAMTGMGGGGPEGMDNVAKYGIDVDNIQMTDVVKNHYDELMPRNSTNFVDGTDVRNVKLYAGESTRPYVNSDGTNLLINEIIEGGTPIADSGGLTNGWRWDVPGTSMGKEGIWELVVDADTNTIVHFLFNSK